jgi:signal transduction histidine kinase/ActR/RegA family two-component response regulator
MSRSGHEFSHFPQESETVELLRSTDWSSTGLGDPSTWPETLRLQLNICFESAFPIAVWWGPDLIQFYNDGYRPILGATKHPQAFGRPAQETWPEIWRTIGAMVEQVVQEGIAVKGEDMPLVLERNGYPELCHFTFSYSPIRAVSGEIVGMFTVAVETSTRVRAERRQAFQLTLSDKLRRLSAADDIVATAAELLCAHLQVTRAFYAEIDDATATFNISAQWTRTADLAPLPATGDIENFGPYLLHALRQGRTVVVEDMCTDPNFAAYAAGYDALGIRSIVITPLIRDGRLRGNLNVAHAAVRNWTPDEIEVIADVASRTWDALERARAEEALRTSNRLKDDFLAMLAHELRNPLAPIGAAADLLQIGRLDETQVRETSRIIGRQVRHMTGLIDDLLDVSRVTRGLVELNMEPLDIGHVVADAVEQVTPLVSARHHRLTISVPGVTTVMGDRNRLVQVLANLLNNAAKYTSEGGTILLSTGVTDTDVVLEIIDTGIGMAPDLAARAFELFTQAERSSDRSLGGLGLGLALVKSIVELHGGTVTCESPGLDKGSRFTVRLPRAAATAATTTGQTTSAMGLGTSAPLRIMVVDDNVDAASLMSMLLEATGHQIEVQHDARTALERSAADPPQVFLLDIGLPEIDGIELARRLRAQPGTADAVLIAITGYGQAEDRARTAAAGFSHHLTKPVDIDELYAILAGTASKLGVLQRFGDRRLFSSR